MLDIRCTNTLNPEQSRLPPIRFMKKTVTPKKINVKEFVGMFNRSPIVTTADQVNRPIEISKHRLRFCNLALKTAGRPEFTIPEDRIVASLKNPIRKTYSEALLWVWGNLVFELIARQCLIMHVTGLCLEEDGSKLLIHTVNKKTGEVQIQDLVDEVAAGEIRVMEEGQYYLPHFFALLEGDHVPIRFELPNLPFPAHEQSPGYGYVNDPDYRKRLGIARKRARTLERAANRNS